MHWLLKRKKFGFLRNSFIAVMVSSVWLCSTYVEQFHHFFINSNVKP